MSSGGEVAGDGVSSPPTLTLIDRGHMADPLMRPDCVVQHPDLLQLRNRNCRVGDREKALESAFDVLTATRPRRPLCVLEAVAVAGSCFTRWASCATNST